VVGGWSSFVGRPSSRLRQHYHCRQVLGLGRLHRVEGQRVRPRRISEDAFRGLGVGADRHGEQVADDLIEAGAGPPAVAEPRLEARLEEAGLDFSHVVASNVYVDDLAEFGKMNGVYGKYFSANPPTRTTVAPLPPIDRKRSASGHAPMVEQVSIIAVKGQ